MTIPFNPWIGCTKVADGCKNCYAEALMDTRYHRVQWGPRGTRTRTKTWNQPKKWNREAAALGERRKVFCASLADVFEDYRGPSPAEGLQPWRRDMFALIDQCPHLDFLLLTKRPENVRRMWEGPNRDNVWIGTSVASQADESFIERLLSCRGLGPILFLSVEPQIGRLDLSRYLFPSPVIDWVIVGGESKQGAAEARPYNLEWARLLVEQCAVANIPCFVKQMGSAPYDDPSERVPYRVPLRLADSHGGAIEEWPDELRVRQCPEQFYVPAGVG